jgi:hypothetical protein
MTDPEKPDPDAESSAPDSSEAPSVEPETTPTPTPADAKPGPRPAANPGFWAFAKQTYGSADPRSLGLFRIALGILLFIDVARRWPDLEAHYSNLGWLTNHFALFRPMSSHLFSVYLAFSTPGEVRVLMLFHLLVCFLFVIGWHTRLMHVLAAVLLVSINSRNILLENGGWVVLTLLTVWTMFLPLGRRFSVDALIASFRERRETTVDALNDRSRPVRDTTPVVSLAVAALIAQWVVIYYFNVVHKSGREWRDGSAVYYFFQQDRMVTGLGAWLRELMPVGIFRVMTYSTLLIESAIAILLASPFRTPWARMVAWALCAALHLSIDAVVQLGPFSWAMVTAFWVLIPAEAWRTLAPRLAQRFPRRVLLINPESGFWLRFGAVVKRFDVLDHIEFRAVTPLRTPTQEEESAAASDDEEEEEDEENDQPTPKRTASENATAEPASDDAVARAFAETLVVIDAESKQLHRGRAALLRLGDAIPFGFFLLLPARLPVLSSLIERRLARAARKTEQVDAYFELEGLPGTPEPLPVEPTPARRSFLGAMASLREAAVLVLIVSCGSQVLIENQAVPKWLKPERRPDWITAIVVYPRLFQGWSMFAPSPPKDDGRIVVDGLTKDGRPLDPLTGQAPNFEVQPKGGYHMNQIWGDFHRRIPEQRFEVYHEGVSEMLRNFHKISGRPEDELKSFEVYFVSEQIPPPGAARVPAQKKRLFGWRAPVDTAKTRGKRRTP